MEETSSTGAGVIRKSSHRQRTWPQTRREEEIPPALFLPRELLLHPIGQRQLTLSRCGRLGNEVSVLEHRSEQGKIEERSKDEETDREPWWGIRKEQIT